MKKTSFYFLQIVSTILIVFSLTFGQQPVTAPAKSETSLTISERETAKHIKVERITEITTKLSAPEMEGRGTTAPGGEKAAKYIAEQFQQLGLKPLGDKNSYLQQIPFRYQTISEQTSIEIGETKLKFIEDFAVLPPQATQSIEVKGELVFVGYGAVSPEIKHDDYANLDLKGKIALVMFGRPKANTPFEGKVFAPNVVIENLLKRGVIGIVAIESARNLSSNFSETAKFLARPRLVLPNTNEAVHVPSILVANSVSEKIFASTDTSLDKLAEKALNNEYVSFNLKKDMAIKIAIKSEDKTGNNVVAILEGSDEKLKEEALVYSAHYDAYGKNAEGVIYPGAADNALGVATMLSLAEAFTKAPKARRSIIFMAVTGEERGLLGSRYWVNSPTWPLEKVAANINFDGIGTEIYGPVKQIVGYGMEHSDLGQIMTEVAIASGCTVLPDPFPSERVFYRSDHFSFVQKGIPAIMVNGVMEGDTEKILERAQKYLANDYHKPTDIIRPDWHWDGPRQVAAVGFVMGLRIVNSNEMPKWKENSEFNRPRNLQPTPKTSKDKE